MEACDFKDEELTKMQNWHRRPTVLAPLKAHDDRATSRQQGPPLPSGNDM